MKVNFYVEGSDAYYFSRMWKGEREFLSKKSGSLIQIDTANKIGVDRFLAAGCAGKNKPSLSGAYDFFALPYELDDFLTYDGCEVECSSVVVGLCNEYLGKEKYVASSDQEKCCVAKVDEFDDSVLWCFSAGHLNTPFLVFDDSGLFFALVDYDFPLQVFGFKEEWEGGKEFGVCRDWAKSEWEIVKDRFSADDVTANILSNEYRFIIEKMGWGK